MFDNQVSGKDYLVEKNVLEKYKLTKTKMLYCMCNVINGVHIIGKLFSKDQKQKPPAFGLF